jgi:hypothetical protein
MKRLPSDQGAKPPTESKGQRGGRRAGAGRRPAHGPAAAVYGMAVLIRAGWSERSAAFGIAALEKRGAIAAGGKPAIDVGSLRRMVRDELDNEPILALVRRAKAIAVAYLRAKRSWEAGDYWGPGPWPEEEERPGLPCRCGETWPFCPSCGTFILPDAPHPCPAAPVSAALDQPHRHCTVCRTPAPEPDVQGRWVSRTERTGWWIKAPGNVEVPVQGSHLVSPVALVHPVMWRRHVLGWACPVHHRSLSAGAAAPAEWPNVELVPGNPNRLAERRKRVTFDEQGHGEAKEARARSDYEQEDTDARVDEAWSKRRMRRTSVPGSE